MLNRVGPRIACEGYVQIWLCIRYESHGVVDITAICKW